MMVGRFMWESTTYTGWYVFVKCDMESCWRIGRAGIGDWGVKGYMG